MNDDFATAMRRSLAQTRAGNPMEATRLIQEALGGGAAAPAEPATRPRPSAARSTRRSAAQVEEAEILGTTPPRRPFGQVIAELAERARAVTARAPSAPPVPRPVPDGAHVERRRFESPFGARDYRLYIPAPRPGGHRGVILMLHGCTQTAEDFAVGTGMDAQAEQLGFVVAYPEQPRAQNAQLCWNWFRPSDQGATAGEPALLAALARQLSTEFAVPERRVFAAGLSAGGAMAAILGTTHPDLFGAVGVHSGLAAGSARDVMSAFGAMRGDPGAGAQAVAVPAIVFQGLSDTTVAPANAAAIAGPLTASKTRVDRSATRQSRVTTGRGAGGQAVEIWSIDGAGHAWAGGSAAGSYADPTGPDASAQMIRFFDAQAA